MTKDLGFGKSQSAPREALDLSDLPSASSAPSESRTTEKFFESTAERIGFKSREPTERVTRQRSKSKEAMDQVYLRAPISVVNRFKGALQREEYIIRPSA